MQIGSSWCIQVERVVFRTSSCWLGSPGCPRLARESCRSSQEQKYLQRGGFRSWKKPPRRNVDKPRFKQWYAGTSSVTCLLARVQYETEKLCNGTLLSTTAWIAQPQLGVGIYSKQPKDITSKQLQMMNHSLLLWDIKVATLRSGHSSNLPWPSSWVRASSVAAISENTWKAYGQLWKSKARQKMCFLMLI